jgi:hypothetical protein
MDNLGWALHLHLSGRLAHGKFEWASESEK